MGRIFQIGINRKYCCGFGCGCGFAFALTIGAATDAASATTATTIIVTAIVTAVATAAAAAVIVIIIAAPAAILLMLLSPTFLLLVQLPLLLQPPPSPRRIAAADLAPSTGADAWPPTPRDLRPWWALLAALVFALTAEHTRLHVMSWPCHFPVSGDPLRHRVADNVRAVAECHGWTRWT